MCFRNSNPGFESHWPHTKVVALLGPIALNIAVNYDVSVIAAGDNCQVLNPYSIFKYSIRSEITRKYYERRLKKFLDFIQFEPGVTDIEKRCNDYAEHIGQNPNLALR